jgi:hypothetical protein
MRRAITPLFAIAMSAALIGGTAATSQAASRAGQQCGNFLECLFGGLNNNNSGNRSGGFSNRKSGGNYGPSTRRLISFSEAEAPQARHHHRRHLRAQPLPGAAGRQGLPLQGRRWPFRLPVVWHIAHRPQG